MYYQSPHHQTFASRMMEHILLLCLSLAKSYISLYVIMPLCHMSLYISYVCHSPILHDNKNSASVCCHMVVFFVLWYFTLYLFDIIFSSAVRWISVFAFTYNEWSIAVHLLLHGYHFVFFLLHIPIFFHRPLYGSYVMYIKEILFVLRLIK